MLELDGLRDEYLQEKSIKFYTEKRKVKLISKAKCWTKRRKKERNKKQRKVDRSYGAASLWYA